MKKTLKIVVSMTLALIMLVTTSLAIISPEDTAPNFSTALDEYFSVRAETLVSPENRTKSVSNHFSALETTRAQNFAIIDKNIEIVDASAEYAIVSSKINGNVAVLDVYEWSWLKYYADDTVTTTNNMGFGTDHRITLNKINGEWAIVNDKYDESDITGVSTLAPDENLVLNYDRSLLNEVYAKTIGVEKLEQQEAETEKAEEQRIMVASSNLNQRSTNNSSSIAANYNPYKAIEYADKWVGVGYASDSDYMIESNYNPDYPCYTSDCVNYVSQCIYEGGVAMISPADMTDEDQLWNSDYWATTKENRTTIITDYACTMSTASWRYTPKFEEFWRKQNLNPITINDNEQTVVYPGNPVYYLYANGTKGHAGICVGYNAAGNLIYNAHNRDVYHITIQYLVPSGYTPKTIQLTDGYTFNTPDIAYDFGVVGETASYGINFTNGEGVYVKFTVENNDIYSMYSEKYTTQPQLDTYAYLYMESMNVSPVIDGETVTRTLHMITLAENDDYRDTGDFGITMELDSGVYYLLIRPYSYNDSGYAHIYVTNGAISN